jgi:uncharacterized protein YyaL (SSP411 family)
MSTPNHLINETSPYLLQHAHNPVEWYPWSEEALSKAEKENKPILVSIGYSACHWCHVMERESFENDETAAIMNRHFVNIKIDREERPDLDHIYMDAVQAMSGSGGWPLNVFLTPDRKPFYGGTYFPPKPAFNRPSWQDVLLSVANAFQERRHEIDAQAENLTAHLLQSNSFGQKAGDSITREKTKEAFDNIIKTADMQWGGFGRAPKFPQTFTIQFLLRYHYASKNEEALKVATLSLDKMIDGGIYDQAGGGFARYSTDTEWLAPHFEKMLYDNALLISVLSEAYQLTKRERYREVIHETMEFIERELLHQEGGFYSALDADSEGEEGKFYVWSAEEIKNALGKDAALFAEFYDVSEKGNWEGKNILRVREPLEQFAQKRKIPVEELKQKIQAGNKKLMEVRRSRVRPGLDDKVILGWNALMNTACSKAYAATGELRYKERAIGNMQFLLSHFRKKEDDGFYHTWKNSEAKYPAFLDDHAYLVQALIHLQEITGDTEWLDKAKSITENVIRQFSEEETGFFYYTGKDQKDVIVRKKEVYDGAVPSGNSVMAFNLYHLGILFDESEWRERGEKMVSGLSQAIIPYPGTFGVWASLGLEMAEGTNEIAVIGKEYHMILPELLSIYVPFRVLITSPKNNDRYPLLAHKEVSNTTFVYLCRDYTCKQPVTSVNALISLIYKGREA